MGNIIFGNDDDADEDDVTQAELERWRPKPGDAFQFAIAKRKKASSKSSDSSETQSESAASESDSKSEQSQSEASQSASEAGTPRSGGGGSEKTESSKEGSEGGSSDDEDAEAALAKKDAKRKKKVVVRMEFEPLLSLHEPLAAIVEEPVELFTATGRKEARKRARAGKQNLAIDGAVQSFRKKAKLVAQYMAENQLETCTLRDIANAMGEDIDELRYALAQSGNFAVDEEGNITRTLRQRIVDVMENDIETLQEIAEKIFEAEEDEIRQSIQDSDGTLRLKVANDIELVERVNLEREAKEAKAEAKEQRKKEKEAKAKAKRGRKKKGEDDDSDDSSSTDGDDEEEEADALHKEAEKKALAFRRVQVQRKIEEFLRVFTKGQNLTKINNKGRRYHRRVYVDTTKKSLVVQGAGGPKFFPFASMREVDLETRTTKEGRVETLVIIAIEKGGRIVKELNLSFPDQGKANTFVNCMTLFSMALRGAAAKK